MHYILANLLMIPLAISAISITASRGKIFRSPRIWIRSKSSWLGGLFSCPYCISHWLAFAALPVCQLEAITGARLADIFIWAFSWVGISALISGAIMSLIEFSPDEDSLLERLKEELVKQNKELTKLKEQNSRLKEITIF